MGLEELVYKIVDDVLEKFHWHRQDKVLITNRKKVRAGNIYVYPDTNQMIVRIFGCSRRLNLPTYDEINSSVLIHNELAKTLSNTISELLNEAKGYTPKKKKDDSHVQMSLDI